ncbi:lipopolysaccharide assembly protein LapB [Tenacibaculum finnmarkense]|uniref:Uncharacterized protein n=1 Tax=Tenacibaculum finnmarkense genomovar ulcerans TaxID=2781388 RepID=A0A2I2LDU4_9FLAO|nr:hypothetical protein [Tenacibaculum finnmarkense]ALU74693.1 hypothetical protein AUW17_05155 [Tenacibaculum dicentrarchi]MBE7634082.1 hypothetical protein [Tenacibaculum finnmarkense genomovar ulcerans]MBE7647747.1 hypothetical protein [Tenacibaculum finnmarkense genomovar ulcerans]MBE7660999.1 hypothetical protein [Tenacibaculum finnmarkense genomovar finnmarkense]MBE7687477.1 hypothetical protein [Tenacibaculum finnmarkense genomovar ulcerans]
MGTVPNNYVFKALDSFNYDTEETMEALNYALSYDAENTMALTLMGRIYSEKLYDYQEGINYFKQVLAIKINAFEVYEPFINALLWNEDVKEAADFIDFALTIKGADKAVLYTKKSVLYEKLKKYKKALCFIKKAKTYTFNTPFMEIITEQKKRIKDKMPKKKVKKKKASEAKKTTDKVVEAKNEAQLD